ncbi:MAG: transcription antiterminator [Lachnotalea sp.]
MRLNKSSDILDYFIKHSSRNLSIKRISDKFGISDKQVKNYVKQLNESTSPNTIIVQIAPNEYHLCDDYKSYMHLFDHSEYLPKDRMSNILSKLLLSAKPLDIFDLADELYVSRPTIDRDLTRVRQNISALNLNLLIKKDQVTLVGTEKDKRRLTSNLITSDYYAIFMNSDKIKYLNESYQIAFLKQNLKKIFDESHIIFNDYSLNNIVLHLAITIDRLKQQYEITDIFPSNLTTNIKKEVTENTVSFLEGIYHVVFSESEKQNLAMFLSCNLATVDYNLVNAKNISAYITDASEHLTQLILLKIKEYYALEDFDEIFVTRFMLHINNLLKRINTNFSVHSPLAKEIMSTYPLIYDIAVFVADIIHTETKHFINQDEISLIALHIGSFFESNQVNKNKLSVIYVYSDYHEFYRYNIEKIQKLFNDHLNVKFSISADNYESSDITADIVMSEVPFPKKSIIVISPFITESEISIIRSHIDVLIHKQKYDQFESDFKYMFEEKLFFTNLTGIDKFQVINKILNKIEPLDYFMPSFPDDVIKREKLSSTCFHNGIAIPHSISQQINKSFISFTCYDKGQTWNDETVKLVILIGIAYPERKMFRSVFNQLISIFTNEAHVLSVSKCRTYDEIINTTKAILDDMYTYHF